MPKVYNKRGQHPPDAILVDRNTVYGNPFVIGKHGTREGVIAKYERWIFMSDQTELRVMMTQELRGKDLLCWCAPQQCHADIILEIANGD